MSKPNPVMKPSHPVVRSLVWGSSVCNAMALAAFCWAVSFFIGWAVSVTESTDWSVSWAGCFCCSLSVGLDSGAGWAAGVAAASKVVSVVNRWHTAACLRWVALSWSVRVARCSRAVVTASFAVVMAFWSAWRCWRSCWASASDCLQTWRSCGASSRCWIASCRSFKSLKASNHVCCNASFLVASLSLSAAFFLAATSFARDLIVARSWLSSSWLICATKCVCFWTCATWSSTSRLFASIAAWSTGLVCANWSVAVASACLAVSISACNVVSWVVNCWSDCSVVLSVVFNESWVVASYAVGDCRGVSACARWGWIRARAVLARAMVLMLRTARFVMLTSPLGALVVVLPIAEMLVRVHYVKVY